MKFSYLNAPPFTFLCQLVYFHTCSMATDSSTESTGRLEKPVKKTDMNCRQNPVSSRYATFQTDPRAVQL